MTFSYRIVRDGGNVIAECVEADCAGTGRSERDAVASLRLVLEERMFRADAVAPPPSTPEARIDLLRVS